MASLAKEAAMGPSAGPALPPALAQARATAATVGVGGGSEAKGKADLTKLSASDLFYKGKELFDDVEEGREGAADVRGRMGVGVGKRACCLSPPPSDRKFETTHNIVRRQGHGEAMRVFRACKAAVARLQLLSANETIDDVATTSIKYLALDFYLGRLLVKSNTTNPRKRMTNLQAAREHHLAFLRRCRDAKILQGTELKVFEGLQRVADAESEGGGGGGGGGGSGAGPRAGARAGGRRMMTSPDGIEPALRRQLKIEHYKREKEERAKERELAKRRRKRREEEGAKKRWVFCPNTGVRLRLSRPDRARTHGRWRIYLSVYLSICLSVCLSIYHPYRPRSGKSGDADDLLESGGRDDEEERELGLLWAAIATRGSISDLNSVAQEMQMLRVRIWEEEGEEEEGEEEEIMIVVVTTTKVSKLTKETLTANSSCSRETPKRLLVRGREGEERRRERGGCPRREKKGQGCKCELLRDSLSSVLLPHFSLPFRRTLDTRHPAPGTSTHIGPGFEVRRETVRAGVFRPSHILPTYTPEQAAEMEMAGEEVERERERERSCPHQHPLQKLRGVKRRRRKGSKS